MPIPGPANLVQDFSTGASLVYLGVGTNRSPVFFGTCEGFPKHERRPQFMELRNDLAGRRVPLDMSFQGGDATLSLDMTVWDEGVAKGLERWQDVWGGTSATNNPGQWRFVDVGALMGLEGLAIPIWIRYPFSGTRISGGPIGSPSGQLPPGYHYFQGIPFPPQTNEEGAQPMVRSYSFYIWPLCNFQTQTFTLFDYDMSAIASAPINGPTI